MSSVPAANNHSKNQPHKIIFIIGKELVLNVLRERTPEDLEHVSFTLVPQKLLPTGGIQYLAKAQKYYSLISSFAVQQKKRGNFWNYY